MLRISYIVLQVLYPQTASQLNKLSSKQGFWFNVPKHNMYSSIATIFQNAPLFYLFFKAVKLLISYIIFTSITSSNSIVEPCTLSSKWDFDLEFPKHDNMHFSIATSQNMLLLFLLCYFDMINYWLVTFNNKYYILKQCRSYLHWTINKVLS